MMDGIGVGGVTAPRPTDRQLSGQHSKPFSFERLAFVQERLGQLAERAYNLANTFNIPEVPMPEPSARNENLGIAGCYDSLDKQLSFLAAALDRLEQLR